MTEPVAAEVLAAIPAGDDDDVVRHALPLQHPQDDHAGAGLSVIVLVLAMSSEIKPQVLWVALANFFLRQSSLMKAFASASDAQGPPETAYFEPLSLIMFSSTFTRAMPRYRLAPRPAQSFHSRA